MRKRVCILIDGQNLYYGLKDIGVLEKDISWDRFLNDLVDTENDELIRTYWFRPEKILDSYYTRQNIENQIIYKEFRNQYQSYIEKRQIPDSIEQQVSEKTQRIEDWLKQEKTKFSNIEFNYDKISLQYDDIELVKTGVVKVNPFRQLYVGEKGVDIALAVKMITLSVEKKCDKIILISGDYDYAEAIKFVKNNMTKIHLVKLHKGFPPKNKSLSRDLAILADKVIDVYESEIKENFLTRNNLP